MADAWKLILPFFSSPTNYSEVLQRLASLLFYQTMLAQIILYYSTPFGQLVDRIGTAIGLHHLAAFSGVAYPSQAAAITLALLVAILIACVAHMARLHDRISDVFGIRQRFDVHCILYPLAILTHSNLNKYELSNLERSRVTLMHSVFYKYASGRAEKPLVDKHDIQQALDTWAWYWVLLEGMVIWALSSSIAVYFGSEGASGFFVACFVAYFVIASLQYKRLEQYARPQVEAIADDEDAAKSVRKEFDAL